MVTTPTPDELAAVLEAMGPWQRDPDLAALHPGDLGWNQQFGAGALAAALRLWHRDGRLVAVGLLDAPDLLRLALAPDGVDDETLAQELADDLDGDGSVFAPGPASVEARSAGRLGEVLTGRGWTPGEAWTPLVRDLAEPVEEQPLRIEPVDPDRVEDRVVVHRGSFERSTFTAERWRAMAAGPAYDDARSLLGYDADGVPVAMVTVWFAGVARPGLLEPMGVHRDHRGRGHGRSICLAAASALRELGASHAFVSTPSTNTGGVATYEAAGYRRHAEVRDLARPD